MGKYRIGITIGDINGIGPEVIIKALQDPRMSNMFTPVIYGSNKILSYHRNIVKNTDFSFVTASHAEKSTEGKINVINCWDENVNITLGISTEEGGKYAHIALDRAVSDLKENSIDALVTGPINKKAMEFSSFSHRGHTEYLTEELEVKESLMTMISDRLKIGLVTNHLPVEAISNAITKETVIDKMTILHHSLKFDFGIEKPSIGILGLNPHAGDEGRIGSQEEEILKPAINEMKEEGNLVFGPYPADGYFGAGTYQKFDATLAMYHDQGLIPFKIFSFGRGINFTAGLPAVRTSPDHGTGYDIVGKNLADPGSMREAIFRAIDIMKCRKEHEEMYANARVKKPKLTEEVEE